MKIHEYQAKAILKKYGVTVPRGAMAASQDEAEAVAKELFNAGASGVVVKAQIHAGGRGKGGGGNGNRASRGRKSRRNSEATPGSGNGSRGLSGEKDRLQTGSEGATNQS